MQSSSEQEQGSSPKGGQPQAHRRHRGRHREATVSFATAALMAVALCFHSILEVSCWT